MIHLILCFVIPLCAFFRISIGGDLSLTEIILGLFALFNINKFQRVYGNKYIRVVTFLGLLWLLSAVASDLYRNTPLKDSLRGWLKIVVLLSSIYATALLVRRDKKRIAAFAMGAYCSALCYSLVVPLNLPYYKFILGFPISGVSFLLLAILVARNRIIAYSFPYIAGAIALFCNARSLAGITLIAAAYPLMVGSYRKGPQDNFRKIALKCLGLMVAGWCILQIYETGASSGFFGEEVTLKYEDQSLRKEGGFSVFSGRSEIFFSVPKIIESPFVGWGSWAKDPDYVTSRSAELGIKERTGERSLEGLIPTHSHFFGAWLEAGIFGAIFWILILFSACKVLLSNRVSFAGSYSCLIAFMLFLFVWDILFSPFGGERRVFNGFLIWVVIVALSAKISKLKSNRKNSYENIRNHDFI